MLHAEVTRRARRPPARRCGSRGSVVPRGHPAGGWRTFRSPSREEGGRVLVRYRFSTVRGGEERFSPSYEVEVPSDDADRGSLPHPRGGDAEPPRRPGRGHFRLVLPLGEGERTAGTFRFGFGAMRKKPSPSLCRAAVDAGYGPAPVIETPEALSVLKNRPMPYFLYHVSGGRETARRQDRLRPHHLRRIADGDVVSARMSGATRVAGHEHLASWRPRDSRPAGTSAATRSFSRRTRRRSSRRAEAALRPSDVRGSSRRSCTGLREAGWSTVSRRSFVGRPAVTRCGGGTGKAEGTGSWLFRTGGYRMLLHRAREAPAISSSVPTVMRRHSASRGVSKYRTRIFRRFSAS